MRTLGLIINRLLWFVPTLVGLMIITFTIHLIVFVRSCKVEASITFLVDEQIREIDFFEFEIDGFDKVFGDYSGRLLAKLHGFGHSVHTKLDHDRIGVTINNHRVVSVTVFNLVSEKNFVTVMNMLRDQALK